MVEKTFWGSKIGIIESGDGILKNFKNVLETYFGPERVVFGKDFGEVDFKEDRFSISRLHDFLKELGGVIIYVSSPCLQDYWSFLLREMVLFDCRIMICCKNIPDLNVAKRIQTLLQEASQDYGFYLIDSDDVFILKKIKLLKEPKFVGVNYYFKDSHRLKDIDFALSLLGCFVPFSLSYFSFSRSLDLGGNKNVLNLVNRHPRCDVQMTLSAVSVQDKIEVRIVDVINNLYILEITKKSVDLFFRAHNHEAYTHFNEAISDIEKTKLKMLIEDFFGKQKEARTSRIVDMAMYKAKMA